MAPKRSPRRTPQRSFDQDADVKSVVFRTYDEGLFHVFREDPHDQFMTLIGLKEFLRLSWTHLHKDLAVEFLTNYSKRKTDRTILSTKVQGRRINLSKKLIASVFHLSYKGYKHKRIIFKKEVISPLFDPITSKLNGYYIRDCKDPMYFERLEALNGLFCFRPPGHLVSAILVDMILHSKIQPVDWAGFLLVSLMKELDRVSYCGHETPCTLIGVHILLILKHLRIFTLGDLGQLVSIPLHIYGEYSSSSSVMSDSFGSSPNSSRTSSPPAGPDQRVSRPTSPPTVSDKSMSRPSSPMTGPAMSMPSSSEVIPKPHVPQFYPSTIHLTEQLLHQSPPHSKNQSQTTICLDQTRKMKVSLFSRITQCLSRALQCLQCASGSQNRGCISSLVMVPRPRRPDSNEAPLHSC